MKSSKTSLGPWRILAGAGVLSVALAACDSDDELADPKLPVASGGTLQEGGPEVQPIEEPPAPVVEPLGNPPRGALTVSGNRIVDEQGVPVALAGQSLFWSNWSGGYWNADVVKWLVSDWEIEILRAPMGVEEDGAYLQSAYGNQLFVETVVDAALEEDIYVIIDWHSHEAHLHVDEAVAFFREMATKYGAYKNVIYEIYNEPKGVRWTDTIKPYAETVISAIRAIDPDNLIIVGTPSWSQDVDEASLDPIADDNVAYTLHFYAASHKQELRDKATTALDNGIPLIVTEWGSCEAVCCDGVVDTESVDEWMTFLLDNEISHVQWAIHDKDACNVNLVTDASIEGGWSEADLTDSGKLARETIRNWPGN